MDENNQNPENSQENYQGDFGTTEGAYTVDSGDSTVYTGQVEGGSTESPSALAIVSLVCGIVALLSNCCCVFNLPPVLGIFLAVAAIVTGHIAKKRDSEDKIAKAGFICGIVSCVLSVLATVVIGGMFLLAMFASAM